VVPVGRPLIGEQRFSHGAWLWTIVAGEALRQAGTARVVNTYIAMPT
jgi:hypothetical protein